MIEKTDTEAMKPLGEGEKFAHEPGKLCEANEDNDGARNIASNTIDLQHLLLVGAIVMTGPMVITPIVMTQRHRKGAVRIAMFGLTAVSWIPLATIGLFKMLWKGN